MDRYKRHLELGDEAITKRTAQRYKAAIAPNQFHESDEVHSPSESSHEGDERLIAHDFDEGNNVDTTSTVNESYDLDLDEYLHHLLLEDDYEFQSNRYPQNLQEMCESKDFFKSVNTPVTIKKGELLLMALKFCISNSLSVRGMTNLFKFVNTIFETPIMPDSKYAADKFMNPKENAEFHAVCHVCSAYIGKFGEIDTQKTCSICEAELELNNPSNTSFFVMLDPSTQIRDLLKIYEDHFEYVMKERRHDVRNIEDVYDGKEYRKFVNKLIGEDKHNYITAVLNTDGAPKFESSQYSIWPVYIMINELPKQERMQKLVTCGLWFNKTKPDMNVFLGAFVDVMNKLTNEGISCDIKGEKRLIKPHVLSCCVDSVARAPIQGNKQFNAYCGCNWCKHPVQWAEGSMRYPLLTSPLLFRDHESTINDMLVATPERPVDGIQSSSALINLPDFNIISGFVPDYLHCCLEGVAKQITNYHLQSMSKDDIKELDFKMNKITAPHQLSRLSRPLSSRNDWKAREWENYVLYYSVPLLSDHLSRNLLFHWLLFVQSLYILLQSSIDITELDRADEMLHEFVTKTEEYYGIKSMTFNVHQLLHICNGVLNWGPLWCQSTFSFESANHHLLKAIKCSKGVTLQILRFININHLTSVLQKFVYPHASSLVKIYCDDILSFKVQNYCKVSSIMYFGRGDNVDNDILNRLQLSQDSTKFYMKMIKDGCLYESSLKSKHRSNNSFVQLKDKRFVQIISFIVDENSKKEYTVCNVIGTRARFTNQYNVLKVIERIGAESIIIPTSEIMTICICMKIDEFMYICPIPNLLHY